MHSTDEGIVQSMMIGEEPWEYYHHYSHLPYDNEDYSNDLNHPSIIDFMSNFVRIDIVNSEHNFSNIEKKIM